MPGVQLALGRGTEKEGRAITLRGTRVLVGRTDRCSIRLEHDLASNEHAALVFDNGNWTLRDLGSSHGTFVNGEQVSVSSIGAGDLLSFGEEGAEIQVLEVDPPSERDHSVPVLDPVRTTPPVSAAAAGPSRPGPTWPGLLVFLAVVGGLVWFGMQPDRDLRGVTRAKTPRDLYRVLAHAAHDGHPESVYDVCVPEYQGRIARDVTLQDEESVREALFRLRNDGAVRVPSLHGRKFVRADLEADGKSGVLVTKDPSESLQRDRIIQINGVWRLLPRE